MVPVLYATRQQPHCQRARLALAYARIPCEWKEVAAERSAEGTPPPGGANGVPLLQFQGGERLGSSMEILHWAVLKNDPDGWLEYEVDVLDAMHDLVRINDSSFVEDLARYRRATSPRQRDQHRADCELFLQGLERRLDRTPYLFGERVSFADAAILPFVQSFAQVEPQWFGRAPYAAVRQWMQRMLEATPDPSAATGRATN